MEEIHRWHGDSFNKLKSFKCQKDANDWISNGHARLLNRQNYEDSSSDDSKTNRPQL